MFSAARELNARCVALLVQAAAVYSAEKVTPAIEALRSFTPDADARACDRAARCPVLLVDLKFQNPVWWERVAVGLPATMHVNAPVGLFTKEAAQPLLHEILMQVWSTARSRPSATHLFFGISPRAMHAIAQLSLPEISRIAYDHAGYLRPRWEDRRMFWQRLRQAAVGEDDEELVDVQLHCLTLLGGDLVPLRQIG